MSAYIVEDKTINRILAYMGRVEFATEGKECYLRRYLPAVGLTEHEAAHRFGQRMFALNAQAVAQRCDEAPEPADNYVYEPEHTPTIHQAYKALSCWLYQCSEGKVPEQRLYQQMQTLQDMMARVIAESTPEYESANWG